MPLFPSVAKTRGFSAGEIRGGGKSFDEPSAERSKAPARWGQSASSWRGLRERWVGGGTTAAAAAPVDHLAALAQLGRARVTRRRPPPPPPPPLPAPSSASSSLFDPVVAIPARRFRVLSDSPPYLCVIVCKSVLCSLRYSWPTTGGRTPFSGAG